MEKLPEGWKKVKLGDLGTFKTSSVDKKVNKGKKWVNLINYRDVYKHNFVDKSLELNGMHKKEDLNIIKLTSQMHKKDGALALLKGI